MTAAMILKDACPLGKNVMTNLVVLAVVQLPSCVWLFATPRTAAHQPRQCIVKYRHHFADKGSYSQSYGFSGSHVQMWEMDHKEAWVPKNWCFQTAGLEKTLESPLNCKDIKPVNPKGSTCVCFCLICGQRLTDKCKSKPSFATHNSLVSMSFDTDKKEHDP